jgi:hypothetical protein
LLMKVSRERRRHDRLRNVINAGHMWQNDRAQITAAIKDMEAQYAAAQVCVRRP